MDRNDNPLPMATSYDDNDSVEAAIGTQDEYPATAVPINVGLGTLEESIVSTIFKINCLLPFSKSRTNSIFV